MKYRSLYLFLSIVSFVLDSPCFAAELPTVIDLNVTPGTETAEVVRVYGETSFDLLGGGGASVAFGDLDGDGLSDLLSGSKDASSIEGATSSGTVYITYGDTGLARHTENLFTHAGTLDITRLQGAEVMGKMGNAVAAGDVNGDGIDDAVIGVAAAGLDGATQAGKIYIFYGDAAIRGATVNLTSVTATTVIIGATAYEHLGWSVAVGDINSDGYTDVLAGAMTKGTNLYAGQGKAYVIYGGPQLVSDIIQVNESTASEGQTLIISGSESTTRLGFSTAAGDVDGDGYDDVILGAPYLDGATGETFYAGGAFVVYGGSTLDGTVMNLSQSASGTTQIFGDDQGDNAGYSVASGDVNGDGFFDVILGAPYENYVSSNSKIGTVDSVGAVYAVYGGSAIRGTTVDLASDGISSITGVAHIIGRYSKASSSYRGSMTGWSVAAGDVNGDGLDDILAGEISGVSSETKNQDGYTYQSYMYDVGFADLVYGATALVGDVILLQDETVGVEVLGDNQGDYLGHAVASAGDMTGDGFAEFAVSAPFGDNPDITYPAQNESGMVALIKGDGVAVKARRIRRTESGNPPPLRFGTAARCLVDYATAGAVSQTTVTIQRSAPENPPAGAEVVLPVQWQIETNLEQFTSAVLFRYTGTELGGADESRLAVLTSPDGSAGSWTWAGAQQVLDMDRNEIRVEGLTHFSLFSLAVIEEPTATATPTPTLTLEPSPTLTMTDTSEPTFTATETLVPTLSPSASPTPTLTLEPSPTSTITDTPEPTLTVTGTPTPTLTPSASPTLTITDTPEPTLTVTETPTPTLTLESSPTPTSTDTPEPTLTPTVTATDTPTPDPTQVLLKRADLNDNGRIDVYDLLIFESLWLREVPE